MLVALSGGPDSTALLAALAALGKWPLAAHHVNHGLRAGEADLDEAAARGTARRLGVPFGATRLESLPGRGGIEARARAGREAALAEAARAAGARAVALGHTRDDQAETVLYRAARGAGPRGLRGILFHKKSAGVDFVRPLLETTREAVVEFLARRELAFVTDSTNADRRFARNRIRHEVLPALEAARPGAARNLARLAEAARELEEWIGAEAEAALGRCRAPGGLDTKALAGLPPPVRDAVLEIAAPPEVRPLRAPDRAALARLISGGPGRRAGLRRGWSATLEETCVVFRPPPAAEPATVALAVPGECRVGQSRIVAMIVEAGEGFLEPFLRAKSPGQEAFDFGRVRMPLAVGPARPGDRLHPLGAPGERKVSDVLADLKIPRADRRRVPVVRDAAGTILWVAGLRRDHASRVTRDTKTALVLETEP
ncbi:MAG: tRNA lysidine(34) synthetase TilS [Planctomycetes bacterium]|nr:tRNA lysidine(34) synthetase TilS [Planctomycetota bacterium]